MHSRIGGDKYVNIITVQCVKNLIVGILEEEKYHVSWQGKLWNVSCRRGVTLLRNVLSHPERVAKRRKDASVKGKVGAQSQEKKHHVCKDDQGP